MNDDPHRQDNQGASVSGNQAEEVRAACRSLGVTPDRLREALRAVGYDGEKVRQYLNQKYR